MSKRLLDEMLDVLRRRHYSIHTERTYCDWVVKYVSYFRMQSRDDLGDAERKISEYLTYLAVKCDVAANTAYLVDVGLDREGRVHATKALSEPCNFIEQQVVVLALQHDQVALDLGEQSGVELPVRNCLIDGSAYDFVLIKSPQG